jgi:hypothetical protein
MAAEHCGEMVGETTPSCLLCESTAREVRHAAGGRRVAGAPSTACEIPVLYSGGGVFTVTRIITVEEPNLHGGVGTFAYGFLRLERGLTLDVTADIVVRHDLERNYSLDESLTVGETLLAFFPRPTSMSDDILESEWYYNEGFKRLRNGAAYTVPSTGLASLKMFQNLGYSPDQEQDEIEQVFHEAAMDMPCSSRASIWVLPRDRGADTP